MRNQIFHSPGNEEAELAKIPGDGDPPPPHSGKKAASAAPLAVACPFPTADKIL